MEVVVWGILILGLAFAILRSLLRKREEDQLRDRTPPRPRVNTPEQPGQRKPVTTDLDRFLQEVNRRRKLAEERGGPQVSEVPMPVRPVPPKPPPRPVAPLPRVTQPPRQPSRPLASPQTRKPLVRPQVVSPPPLVIAVDEPSGFPVAQPAPPPAVEPTPNYSAETVTALGSNAPARLSSTRKPATPSRRKAALRALLTSGENLQAAMILREIFDAPLCRRR
jgi:hypothetical protein